MPLLLLLLPLLLLLLLPLLLSVLLLLPLFDGVVGVVFARFRLLLSLLLSVVVVPLLLILLLLPVCCSRWYVGVFRALIVLEVLMSFFNVPVRLFLVALYICFLQLFIIARFWWSQPCSTSYTAAVALIVCFLILLLRHAIMHLDRIILACRRTSKPRERSHAAASRSFATEHAMVHVSLFGVGRFKVPILTLGLEVLLEVSWIMLGICKFLESCRSMSDWESNFPQWVRDVDAGPVRMRRNV